MKVLKNAKFAYAKLIFNVIFGLLTIKYALAIFGLSGFGVYSLVNSIVLSITFMNSAMTLSCQRFISHELGRAGNGGNDLSKIVSNAKLINLFFVILTILIFLLLYQPLFSFVLSIPIELIGQATQSYIISLITVFFIIFSIPVNAVIIAKEDIWLISIFEMITTGSRLAYLLIAPSFIDVKITNYFIFISVVECIIYLCKKITVNLKYSDIKTARNLLSKSEIKKQINFMGWNTFGSLSGVIRTHGLNIAINSFFGIGVSSVYAIAMQINAQLKNIPNVLFQVFSPKIIKYEGSGNRRKMIQLTIFTSKVCLLLFFSTSITFMLCFDKIISLWLGGIPEGLKDFVILFIIMSAINVVTIGYQSAIQALGEIKIYQMSVAGTNILSLPIGILLFNIGYPAYSILISAIILEMIAGYLRVYLVERQFSMRYCQFWESTGIKLIFLMSANIIFIYFYNSFHTNSGPLVTTAAVIVYNIFLWGVSIMCMFDRDDKNLILEMINDK